MTQDSTKKPDAESTVEDARPEGATVAEVRSNDPTASQIFFGDHLSNLVHGKAPPEPEITTTTDGEKTLETPSMLFFGEHLEEACREPEAAAADDEETPEDEG